MDNKIDYDNSAIISTDESWYTLNTRGDTEKLARIRDQLIAFQKIATIIGSEASIEEVLEIICNNTTQLMRCERTTIFIVETDERKQKYLKSFIAEKIDGIKLSFGQGIAGTVALNQKYLNIKDVYKSALFDPSFDKKTGFRTRSCLAMPIMDIHHEMIGVVQVMNKLNGYFEEEEDVDMLASICSQIAVSITQHRAFRDLQNKNEELREAQEKLQRKNIELDMLYDLEREAATSIDLYSLVERTIACCNKAFEITFSAILVTDENQNTLFMIDESAHGKAQILSKIPPFLVVPLKQHACVRISLREISTLPEQTEKVFGIALNALIIAPLPYQDNLCGVLILGTQEPVPGVFSDSDAKLASIFAAHIAPSIMAQIHREENEKKQRLFVIGQMLASLLHDMKTPLANISGYTELMISQSDAEKRANYAEVVDRQVNTLKNMSAEILQFSRGQTSVILRKSPLHNVITQSVDLLIADAQKRNIEIKCNERFTGAIYYDEDKLQRVIVNLVKNAIEALEKDGVIEINTYTDNKYVYVMISDNGPGIPPAIAQTLFDAFVTSGKKGGTGLGLSIVKKIIEEHHASITWQPVEPHGTSFIMAFPPA